MKIFKYILFAGDYNLEKVVISEGVKQVESYAFKDTNFTNIVIPSTLQKIEKGIFDRNKKLKDITIKNGANFIYENGMLMEKNKENILFISSSYLNNKTQFLIPEGVKKFNADIRDYKNIKKIIIPSSLEEFLKAIDLPETIEEIEVSPQNKKFSVSKEDKILYTKDKKEIIACYSKEENINIDPNNNIGFLTLNDWSFVLATNAKRITLPDSLISIGAEVFENNQKLEELVIGKNVSNINPIFKYLNYNGTVIINPENNYYTIENNVLYNKTKSKLIAVLEEINGEFNIENTVKEIGANAFHNQYKMTYVNIPASVNTIGAAFNYCKFDRIDIPESVEEISDFCFTSNPYLDKIIVHKKENSIPGAPWGAVKGMKVVEWK